MIRLEKDVGKQKITQRAKNEFKFNFKELFHSFEEQVWMARLVAQQPVDPAIGVQT